MIKIHKVGDRTCLVYKQDNKWIQVLFIPSAWENKYYVITEYIEKQSHVCCLLEKEIILEMFGNAADEILR